MIIWCFDIQIIIAGDLETIWKGYNEISVSCNDGNSDSSVEKFCRSWGEEEMKKRKIKKNKPKMKNNFKKELKSDFTCGKWWLMCDLHIFFDNLFLLEMV